MPFRGRPRGFSQAGRRRFESDRPLSKLSDETASACERLPFFFALIFATASLQSWSKVGQSRAAKYPNKSRIVTNKGTDQH
jgi:hypothetical protein